GDRDAVTLFWGHVSGCAANGLARAGGCRDEFGDPKISQQDVRIVRCLLPTANEEVGRLDILVNDLMVVSMLECVRRLIDDMGYLLRQKQFFPSSLPQPISE